MKKINFFEIPIYRCSYEQFLDELKIKRKKLEKELHSVKIEFPEKFNDYIDNLMSIESYNYEYNEIIGWINLFVYGHHIRGEYFFEKELKNPNKIKQKFNKTIRKKRFGFIGKAFAEIKIHNDTLQTSQELLKRLKSINKEESFLKNRQIDLSRLENVIQFLNWNSLMNESTKK